MLENYLDSAIFMLLAIKNTFIDCMVNAIYSSIV